MNGKEVFRFAVRCVPSTIEASLDEAGITCSNIDWLLLHQVGSFSSGKLILSDDMSIIENSEVLNLLAGKSADN